MTTHATPAVERLWIRPTPGAPSEPQAALRVVTEEGVAGDHTRGRMRHITLLFADDWRAAGADLGLTLDPMGRRANVLLSGSHGGTLVGSVVRLGDVRIRVKGITRPCEAMEKVAPGLYAALKTEGRGGVWGRILAGGTIRPGDTLQVEAGRDA